MRSTIARVWLLLAAFFAALPSPAPAQSPAAAERSERGKLDIDTASGYARLLFTYPDTPRVAASIADGVLTIRLGAPVDANVDFFLDRLKGYVGTGRRDAEGLTYRFAVARALALHTSSVLNKAVVDLVPDSFKGVPPDLPPPPPPPPKPAEPDISQLDSIPVRVGEFANFTRLVFEWPKEIEYSVYPGRGRVSVRFKALGRPDFAMLEERKPAWVRNTGWRVDGMDTVVDFDTEPEASFTDSRDGNKIIIDVMAPKTDAAAVPPAKGPAVPVPIPKPPPPANIPTPNPAAGSDAAAALNAAKALAPAVAAPPARAPEANPAAMRPPSAELTRDGGLLRFPLAKGHGVAAFVRGETTWVVLGEQPVPDIAALIAPITNLIGKADAYQVPGAAVMKFTFRRPLLASVSETDAATEIRFTSGRSTPPDGINLTRQGSGGQTVLTTPLAGARRAVTIFDNEAGDRLLVVPARPGKGMLTDKRFVEMAALASAAGLAVVPLADDLIVKVDEDTVIFSRPSGLMVSSASGAAAEPVVQMEQGGEGPAFIDFAQWSKGPVEDVYASVRLLREAAARLPESESTKARLQLARYLAANGLGPETLGVLGIITASDGALARDVSLIALKGAAEVMMGRNAAALATLSADVLARDPHAAFWRGIAATRTGDYGEARHDLLLAKSVIALYPQDWQNRAKLARAETGIEQGDLANAADALDQLPKTLPPRQSVEARLYAAELLAAQGHINEAVARLRTLEQTDYAPVAAKATYARVETLLNAKKIEPAEAIETLETLRYRWRGDGLELNTLRKLGNLYLDNKRWREGLTTLRIAALNFAGNDLSRDAQDDMRRAFSDLFLGDKGADIPAVQVLALFYDFKELTPVGRDGDEMIRRLSDKLVDVDLLGPAEELLDYQIGERLEGIARASVATKLAVIYLLDRKPNEALRVLNATRQTRLPDDLTAQRRILEARALTGLKRHDAALALIADADSTDAKRLRAEIYWDAADWKMAGAKIEDLLGNRWEAETALSTAEREEILRAAVAYSLAGDEPKLESLRAHYAEQMGASEDSKIFAVVTERIDRQGVAFRDLAGKIASIDTLQAFMQDLRKRAAPAGEPRTAAN